MPFFEFAQNENRVLRINGSHGELPIELPARARAETNRFDRAKSPSELTAAGNWSSAAGRLATKLGETESGPNGDRTRSAASLHWRPLLQLRGTIQSQIIVAAPS